MLGKKHLSTVVVAMVTAAVTAGAPAIAHGVHAAFAHNADRVDGKSAVGAGAPLASRAGKLVAANSGGRLPNNIIAKALDADKLDGLDSASFLPVGGTATNADRLDGLDGSELAPRIYDDFLYSGLMASDDLVTNEPQPLLQLGDFDSERGGRHLVIATFSASAHKTTGTGHCEFQLRIDGEYQTAAWAWAANGTDFSGLAFATTTGLASGPHLLSVWLRGTADSCTYNVGGVPVRYLVYEL